MPRYCERKHSQSWPTYSYEVATHDQDIYGDCSVLQLELCFTTDDIDEEDSHATTAARSVQAVTSDHVSVLTEHTKLSEGWS